MSTVYPGRLSFSKEKEKLALDGFQPMTLCSLGEDSTKGQLSWYMGSNLQHKTIHMNALLKTKFSHCKNENKCLSIRVRE